MHKQRFCRRYELVRPFSGPKRANSNIVQTPETYVSIVFDQKLLGRNWFFDTEIQK